MLSRVEPSLFFRRRIMNEQENFNEPNRYTRLEIWMGLPLTDKIRMIWKQFWPGV